MNINLIKSMLRHVSVICAEVISRRQTEQTPQDTTYCGEVDVGVKAETISKTICGMQYCWFCGLAGRIWLVSPRLSLARVRSGQEGAGGSRARMVNKYLNGFAGSECWSKGDL